MRVFLVVIDETDEARSALRYAARRAGASVKTEGFEPKFSEQFSQDLDTRRECL